MSEPEVDPTATWEPLPIHGAPASSVANVLRLVICIVVFVAFVVPALAMLAMGVDAALVRQRWLRLGARVELRLLGVCVVVSGTPQTMGGPVIFVANHGSLLDVLLFAALVPTRALLRREFARVPLLGALLERAGHILVARTSPRAAARSLDLAAASLARGESVLLFPEGTRQPHGTLGPFKAGAIRLALRSGAPILPICVLGAAALLPRGSARFRPGTVRVVFGEPIVTTGWSRQTIDAHVAHVRAAIARPIAAYRVELKTRRAAP